MIMLTNTTVQDDEEKESNEDDSDDLTMSIVMNLTTNIVMI